MTTANKVTIVRILLVPFFVVHLLYYVTGGNEVHRLLAIVAFAFGAVSDGIDGYIARRYNQRSELGAILDPLADKLLLVLGLVLLSQNHAPYLATIPLWMTVTVFSRDALLLLGLIVIYYACGRIVIRPRFIGKVATVLQMVTLFWTLLKWDPLWLERWALGATVCTGASGLLYLKEGVRQLSASPTSSASPDQRGGVS
ncbi:MAG: CDP-alcohol phosphatidyltransferase family protein [Verrucomicrobia bacterium]|nr:CDP-alcohol phosphatidyltransferase family protein [Verrucomicrobiota bacterium]